MPHAYSDGGRHAAGFRGVAGDCVVRAFCVATETDYRSAYNALGVCCRLRGYGTPRSGVHRSVYDPFFASHGLVWHPLGAARGRSRSRANALDVPAEGRLILRLARHLSAVVDGVLHDTYDSQLDGDRCLYGYWRLSTERSVS